MRWPGSRKTVEGTLAGFAGILLCAAAAAATLPRVPWVRRPLRRARTGCAQCVRSQPDAGFAVAALLTCLLESFTEQIDNLFLPLFFYSALLLFSP